MKTTGHTLPIRFLRSRRTILRVKPARSIANRKSKIKNSALSRWWLAQAAKLLFLSTFNLQLSTCNASTITGTIQNTSGNAYATNALFAPLSTPLATGNTIIASTPTNVVAAANGTYSVSLKQGNYLVTFGGLRRDSVLISVPDDSNTYNLNALITNAMTFAYTYSPTYEQRVNKGQVDGYVGLVGTVLSPNGLTASNFNFRGTVNLGTDAANYATLYVNQNSTVYVQPGGGVTLSGDSSPRAELLLHGTNAFIRFDEDAGINDSTASRVWKFNRFNVTSNNVATLGDATNVVNSLGTVPVGAIVAWHKTFTHTPALPAQFVECNGQTLSDASSVYNGQVIPNLNGNNNFLRGNSTSGGTGGAATHTHTVDLSLNVVTASGADTDVTAPFPGTVTTTSADSRPPYMDIVWVIRIK